MSAFTENFVKYKKENPSVARDSHTPAAFTAIATYTIAPLVSNIIRQSYYEYQGGLDISVERMKEVDSEVGPAWFSHRVPKILERAPVEPKVTYAELANNIRRNTVYVVGDSGICCNGLLISSGYLLMPKHSFLDMREHGDESFKFYRKPILGNNGKPVPGNAIVSNIPLSKYNVHSSLNLDMVLIESIRIGSVTNIIEYFPSERMNNTPNGLIIHRDKHGNLQEIPCTDITSANYRSGGKTHIGYSYNSSNFMGLCGSPIIDTSRKHSFIIGFHNAGCEDTNFSAALYIRKTAVEEAMKCLSELPKQGGFSLESFGVDYYSPKLHVNSALLSIPKNISGIQVIGSVTKRNTPVNKIMKTLICDDLRKSVGHSYSWGPPPIHGPKGDDKRYPIRRFLDIYSEKQDKIDMEVLQWAYEDYKAGIDKALVKEPERWKGELVVLKGDQVINGIPGKKFVNVMNMATSTSKFLPGSKNEFAYQDELGNWHVVDIIQTEYNRRNKLWRNRKRSYEPMFMMPKIEPTPSEKILIGKMRVMFGCGIVSQMLIRTYALTTVRMFCILTSTTEVAVGTNPHSKRWNELVLYMKELTGENWLGFDFPNFDINMPPEVLKLTLDIIFHPILSIGDIDEGDRNAIAVLKMELLQCVVDMNGDLTIITGIITSGNNLTSLIGCVANSLILRCSFRIIYRNRTDILTLTFSYVARILTFGDDSIGKVRGGYEQFNIQAIIEALATMGIKISNCHKDGRIVIYYTILLLEFLKRQLVYNNDFGCYVAPLSIKSITKQLSAMLPPTADGCNVATITASNIDGALFELKFHGRKTYEYYRTILKRLAVKHGIDYMCRNLDISYDEMVYAWKINYDPEQVTDQKYDLSVVQKIRHSWVVSKIAHYILIFNQIQNFMQDYTEDQNHPVENMVGQERPNLIHQSGSERKPVVNFIGDTLEQEIGSAPLPEDRVHDDMVELGEFLSRPVRVADYSWAIGTVFTENLDPWEAFVSDKRVANRINNYKLLRAKCHVKIIVNGNGFFYGRLMCSYQPLDNFDDFTGATAFIEVDKTQLSLMPTVYVDPTTSQGGAMELPFFTPYDYIDATNLTEVGLGVIRFRELSPLKHANNPTGALPIVSVTVYAWFTDVQVLAPTHANSSYLIPQSGREEETEEKPVSQALTSLSNAASTMTNMPVIGPYASAVEQGSRMASQVASMLGYCQPTNVTEATKVVQRYGSNMATTNSADDAEKLSYDVKQEIVIDPVTVGLNPVDQMSFSYITSLDCYLTKFTWTRAAPTDTFLWNTRVGPTMYAQDTPTGAIVFTGIGGCCYPFSYWTGSIVYKFVVVASGFHRGRIAIQYDPSYSQNVALNPREDNVAFTKIVDISETREFEITVSNHNELGYLPVDNITSGPQYSSSTIYTGDLSGYNGTLMVSVQNVLTTANPDVALNQDIEILVFCKGGPDLAFGGANGGFSALQLKPQSGMETADAINTSAPFSPVTDTVGDTVFPKFNKVYMGEHIDSFRTLSKRYSYYRYESESSATAALIWRYRHPIYPLYRGPMTLAVDGTYNYVNTPLISYIMCAFTGVRGSTRWKYVVNTSKDSVTAQVAQRPGTVFSSTVSTTALTTRNQIEFQSSESVNGGLIVSDPIHNKCIEFEVPFYNQWKFTPSKQQNMNNTLGNGHFITFTSLQKDLTVTGEIATLIHVAGGDDFDCLFFTGWPRMYWVTTFPP
jgi:hypothetical protein